jgi:hypothetical protein
MAAVLQSATVLNKGFTVKVSFSVPVLQLNPAGTKDGLNPQNWSLTGPGSVRVLFVSTVSGDARSLYLALPTALPSGSWLVSAINVTTPDGVAVQAPAIVAFTWVPPINIGEPLNPGAIGDDAEAVLTKHWPDALDGINNEGLIAALAAGDSNNFNNAELVANQLYRSTASGVYLDRRMSDYGLQRPVNVGLGDSAYRQLGLKLTNRKVVSEALLDILNAYYGQDSCRAHITTTVGEPFALQNGWTLTLKADGQAITVPIKSSDYTNVAAAKAIEVAAVITRWLELNDSEAYALAYLDPNTGLNLVRIYSGALGLGGNLAVTGGEAQNVLQFPTLITQARAGDFWAVAASAPGVLRYTLTSNVTTTNLLLLQVGDYVNVFGANFNVLNQGTLAVTNVDVRVVGGVLTQFFETLNSNSVSQGSVSIVASSDMMFFRPQIESLTSRSALDAVSLGAFVSVSSTKANEVDVQLPTTTIAVSRGPNSGAYAVVQPSVNFSSVIRQPGGTVTATTSTPHGLVANQWFFLDGEVPASTPPAVVTGNGSSTTNASPISIWTNLGNMPGNLSTNCVATSLQNGKVLVTGGYTGASYDTDARLIAITGSAVQANGGTQYTYTLTSAAAVPNAVSQHQASVLTDANQGGNVLLTGGYAGAGSFTNAYIYNVAGNSWSANIPMSVARRLHTETTLVDNRIAVTGGISSVGGTPVSSVEFFTPSVGGGAWATGSQAMLTPRASHQAVLMSDGKLLLIGGYTNSAATPTQLCEIYDAVGNKTVQTGNMIFARSGHVAAWLPGDKVLVVGGLGYNASQPAFPVLNIAVAELYDYSTGRWSAVGAQSLARSDTHALYLSASNKVIVFGGSTAVDYFDVATRTWMAPPSVEGFSRTLGGSALLNGNLVAYAGGTVSASAVKDVDVFQPAGDQISGGGLNAMQVVATAPNGTTLTFQTVERTASYAAAVGTPTLTPVNEQPAAIGQLGPYTWDSKGDPAIGNVSTTTTVSIRAKQHYASLGVGSSVGFPDAPGWLVLGFGTSAQTYPVYYTGLIDNATLALDYTTVFPVDIPSGSSVILLVQKGPWTPPAPQQTGSFYLTDTASARVAAESSIAASVAAGLNLVETIVYPGDRGLGGGGFPTHGSTKLSDRVEIWSGDDVDVEVATARVT